MPNNQLKFNRNEKENGIEIKPELIREKELMPRLNHFLNINGDLVTRTTIPTTRPKKLSDSIVLYMDSLTSPTVKRLYIFSREAGEWNYINIWAEYKAPNSVTLDAGSSSSVVAALQTLNDGSYYHIDEQPADPGFDLKCNFTNVTEFNTIVTKCLYIGSDTHDVGIEIYNYSTSTYDRFDHCMNTAGTPLNGFVWHTIKIPPTVRSNYVDGSGNAIVRFHHIGGGNVAHDFDVEYIAIIC